MIPLANCDITDLERNLVNAEMTEGMISGTGPMVREFEIAWEERTGRKHAIAVTNGTVAIEAALAAIDIKRGDEVIVPALTFAAPAAAVRRAEAVPVFADVTEESWTIDPRHVEQLINDKTRAIIPVNVFGHPCEYEQLFALAQRYALFIIEDAAESHGAIYNDAAYTGSFGDISTFSFHANKTITTGEGGMVLTDEDYFADSIRLLINHGMRKPYFHEIAGTNARMTNITAAIGCGQMERWGEIMYRREQIAERYREIIKPPFAIKPSAWWAKEKLWLQVVTIDESHRARVLAHLRECGIDARAIWTALPYLPIYKQQGCDVAKRISRSAFWLPTFNQMGESEFLKIEEALKGSI